jgi:hypothetical protein
MQNLQIRSTLSPRIRELEKRYSRYEIDLLLLAEGYTPAIIEDAWKRKDYKEEFNQTDGIPGYKGYKETPKKSYRGKGKLNSQSSIMARGWHIFLILLVSLIAVWALFTAASLLFTYRWYVANEAKLTVDDLYKLTDYRNMTLVLGIMLIVSMAISSVGLFRKSKRQSVRYVLLMVYYLLLFLGTIWLFFQFTALPDKYYW